VAVDVIAIDVPGADPARMLQHESDEGLARLVRAGHVSAFEAIYDRHHRKLLAFCRHLLWNKEEAEDALQHTFASAYRALTGDATLPDALRPWLYTIARNRCTSMLRVRQTRETVDDPSDGVLVGGLTEEVQQRSDLRDLVADLHRLPEEQRAALVLFELGDHSHAEIATVLSVSREKVKALVFQAREGLLRARTARDTPCADIRRDLSSRTRALPRRGVVRGHLDRCPACAAFDLEVRRQRAALALILPVVPSLELKGSVLGPMLGGGATIAGGGVVLAGGSAGVGAGAAGVGAAATGAGAGAGAVGGIGGGGGVAALATSAGGLGAAGAASGLGALAAKTVVAKALTVVAVATAAAGTTKVAHDVRQHHPAKDAASVSASVTPAPVLAPAPNEQTTTISLPATHATVTTTTTTPSSSAPAATTATAPSGSTTTPSTTQTPSSTGGSAPAQTVTPSSAAPAPTEPTVDPGTGGTAAPPAVANAADPAPAADPPPAASDPTPADPPPAATDPTPADPVVVSADELPPDGGATTDPVVGVTSDPADPNAPLTCPPGSEPDPTATPVPPDVAVDPVGGVTAPAGTDPSTTVPATTTLPAGCVAVTTGASALPDPASGAAGADAAAATPTP
jgi:RNA polymerase sigma factor (sigma-70 family)